MAHLTIVEPLPVSSDEAFALASDLDRLGEWLPLHEGWRSELPELAVGAQVTSVVRAKGIRNRVSWTITDYDPPARVRLAGVGVGGTKVALDLSVRDRPVGSEFVFTVEFSHPALRGPMGKLAERTVRGDLERAVASFQTLASS